jgi:hypothetical protein
MSKKHINIQVEFDGPSPLVGNATSNDKRTSLINIKQLLNNLNHGTQYRAASGPKVTYQDSLVSASATATAAAVQAADTVSIGGQALTAGQFRASGTLTISSGSGQVGGTIEGTLITVLWATSDTASATALAAAINASPDPAIKGVIEAKSAAGVVTVYAKNPGTGGNAYTLVASGTGVTASGATLANGAAFTNNHFDYIGTNAETATDLARAINASTTAAVKTVTAAAVSAVVTVTSKQAGVAGNATTFTSSNGTRLAVTGSGFLAGGTSSAPIQWSF